MPEGELTPGGGPWYTNTLNVHHNSLKLDIKTPFLQLYWRFMTSFIKKIIS